MRDYLNPTELNKLINVKSFILIKQASEVDFEENRLLEKRLASKTVFSFIHLVFFKTLPCPKGTFCKNCPRKIVHKNDFLDVEMDCFFYHHEKDHRRLVLNEIGKEFRYAGNFADSRRLQGSNKLDFSLNFFESLFHPLYYKNFSCVRTKCEKSVFCPYHHSPEEKNLWNTYFK
mmetsp:Transcript_2288/g.2016  ORF Transcript_2288/g.2016 Transcript_2288/m.2016 type:complete len:174 (-) Transcript_2288:212-733(-)